MPTEKQLKARAQFEAMMSEVSEFEGGVLAAPPWHTESLWKKIDEIASKIEATPEHVNQMRGLAERLTAICYGHDFGILWVPEPQIDVDKNEMEFLWLHLKCKRSLSFMFNEDNKLVMSKVDVFKFEDRIDPSNEEIIEQITWILSMMDFDVD